MINRAHTRKVLVIIVIFTLSTNAYSQKDCYTNSLPILSGLVHDVAAAVVADKENAADFISSRYTRMVALTVADALSASIQTDLRALEAYRYIGETARTDQQVGASATSSGSTSAIEKPGLVDLLGLAVEYGAIQQEVSDTALTLSTSPYALIAAVKGDTPDTYQNYEIFSRLGVSATFNLSDKNNVLSNASRKQLTEWSARLRLSGDRSTRSAKFQQFWDDRVAPVIKERINITQNILNAVENDVNLKPLMDPSNPDSPRTKLKAQVTAYLSTHAIDADTNKTETIADIKDMILCHLGEFIFKPVQSGTIHVDPNTMPKLSGLFENLEAAHAKINRARQELKEFLERFMKERNLSNFSYTNHRVAMGSDYSDLKLLFERHVKPFDLIANAGISLYNDPDRKKNQRKIRDFSLALSLEASSKNPFTSLSKDSILLSRDLSRITYSLTGRYERLKENENMPGRRPDIANFQLKIEIPFALGLSLPISYTYATATEMSMKKESKFNIGLHLNMDKLIALRRSEIR